MRKTVLTFGLISGAVSSAMMLLTIPSMDRIGFSRAEVIGYTTLVAAFLLVFFGIRSYRDHVVKGPLTFGRAFTVGILITLVSCACYVATWQVLYYNFTPDFIEKYGAYAIARAQASGASEQEIEETRQQMKSFAELYRNPLANVAITFVEPFPVGLAVTVISAAVLRRKA